eukprot:Gregarina_sp_Pseudo_9__4765@NODE_497_length_2707_cov_134_778486_g469_i0_p1_GENE_NODE_497_length_2707_cov_134_778486_g469_i0NODE_497_length_2707_cov_134_778486_g469_i0_p1_ORF_typecomplete_len479_score72_73Picorna_P3A/PF06363_11/0_66Picorna_P3A/PF06363_11/43Picorna_P3A/PF06363_11/2_1e03DUF2561/PF10812_8/3_6DUF2561/PF10812_8/15MHYT/PF03707_16/1_1e03MHYT/PF03707_16/1_3e04MHYT/PF03707_16/1_4e04MHYT/PF03707_16/4_2e03MHYT/PF03707_16/1_3e03MHYT/PF03707_16/0_15Ninjurin/PF04923_12/1_5Ninjurin/PF04923_12/1
MFVDEHTQKKWHRILVEDHCKLYSQRTPPLCRRMRFRWMLYLLSSCLKMSVGVGVLVVTLVALTHLGDKTEEDALGHETAHKIAIFSSAFANFAIFVFSAMTDLSVFLSAPQTWAKFDPTVKDLPVITTRGYGNIEPSFFASQFAERHRLHTYVNRAIATVSTTLCIICAIPKSSWRLEGCSMVYRIKDYIMTPFPEEEQTPIPMANSPALSTGASCSGTTLTLSYTSLFWLQATGVLCCHLTMHLWHSYPFTIYMLLGWMRFLLGVVIFSLASRYFAGLGRFLSSKNEAYNALALDVKTQVVVFLYTLFSNGLAGGTFAYVGGAYSMLVTWRRNQFWLSLDVGVISVVGLVLLATFVSNYWLNLTHDFFCAFSYFYPEASAQSRDFAKSLCQSMSFRFRMNYQYWLTFISAMIAIGQLILGLFILSDHKAMLPKEWVVARQLMVDHIKRQKDWTKRHGRGSMSRRAIASEIVDRDGS